MFLTLSGGQDDLLLSGGILQFLRVETLQLALQILGHLGQILECWCWCCWGCHLQEIERKKEIKSNLKENKNKLRISCIFPLHLSITTQSPNNKNPDIDSGLWAITAVELFSIKRKCASITQRSLLNLLTRTRILHVCVCGATFCVVYRFVFISCDFPWWLLILIKERVCHSNLVCVCVFVWDECARVSIDCVSHMSQRKDALTHAHTHSTQCVCTSRKY